MEKHNDAIVDAFKVLCKGNSSAWLQPLTESTEASISVFRSGKRQVGCFFLLMYPESSGQCSAPILAGVANHEIIDQQTLDKALSRLLTCHHLVRMESDESIKLERKGSDLLSTEV